MDVGQATDLCQSVGAGRVVFDSEEKQRFIDGAFKSKHYWLALQDRGRSNTNYAWFRADDSYEELQSSSFRNWLENEPSNTHDRWVVNTCKDGKCGWSDVYHDYEAEVICQKSKAGKQIR